MIIAASCGFVASNIARGDAMPGMVGDVDG
jgi:hypothetical protein